MSDSAETIARTLIAKVSKARAGPEYEAAVMAAAVYWDTVMDGEPRPEAKEAADQALSKLLGMRAGMTGRKKSRTENLKRAIYDTFTRRH